MPYGIGAVLLASVEMGNWPVQGEFAARTPCLAIPDDPQTPQEFLTRAMHRLEISDLEGGEADFRALADLEPDKGEGPLGVALVQAFFTGFRVFDEFTRYTIDESSWEEFQQVIREEILPSLAGIRQRLLVAGKDAGFSMHIPVMTLNRRGCIPRFGISGSIPAACGEP